MHAPADRLNQVLSDLADDVQPDEVTRVGRQTLARVKRARRKNRILASVGGAATAAVVLAALNSGSPPDDTAIAGQAPAGPVRGVNLGDGLAAVKPGEPCPMAKRANSPDALDTHIPHWAPAHERASAAWTCGDTPVVIYGEIQVSYEEGWRAVPVETKWQDSVKESGGEVVDVLGRSAYVHAGSVENGTSSTLLVVVDDILIRLLAPASTPTSELIELADSIKLPSRSR